MVYGIAVSFVAAIAIAHAALDYRVRMWDAAHAGPAELRELFVRRSRWGALATSERTAKQRRLAAPSFGGFDAAAAADDADTEDDEYDAAGLLAVSHYALLRVPDDATRAAIKRAFHTRSKEDYPRGGRRLSGGGDEGDDPWVALMKAHDVLVNDKARCRGEEDGAVDGASHPSEWPLPPEQMTLESPPKRRRCRRRTRATRRALARNEPTRAIRSARRTTRPRRGAAPPKKPRGSRCRCARLAGRERGVVMSRRSATLSS